MEKDKRSCKIAKLTLLYGREMAIASDDRRSIRCHLPPRHSRENENGDCFTFFDVLFSCGKHRGLPIPQG